MKPSLYHDKISTVKKNYTYRAYPTVGQQRMLSRTFGCVRVVYNDFIAIKKAEREKNKHLPKEKREYLSNAQIAKTITTLAKKTEERAWLSEVSAVPLQSAVQDAQQAYTNFFDSLSGKRKGPKMGAPRYRSKHAKKSARFTRAARFKVRQTTHGVGKVYLPKVGWVRFTLSRTLPSDLSSVTITQKKNGTYEVSFVIEIQTEIAAPTHRGRIASIDLGLTDFATIVYSDGTREKITNPRHLKKAQRKLRKQQKSLSRKVGPDKTTGQKASNNYKKQQLKVAQVHFEVADSRSDFHNKLVHRLTRENQGVIVEKLGVLGLSRSGAKGARGKGLRRSINDAAWGTFLRKLASKTGEQNRDHRVVNPPYTSQRCSNCQVIDGPKPLNIREWECKNCGAQLDRDYNAAVNIMVAAGHVETLNARGADIRQEKELLLLLAGRRETRTHRSDLEKVA